MKTSTAFTAATLFASVAFAAPAMADDNEIELEHCPPEVAASIEEQTAGWTLDEIEVVTVADRSLYVADAELASLDLTVHVAEDGAVVSRREEIPLEDSPQAVQASLANMDGNVDQIERVTDDNGERFEAEFDRLLHADRNVVLQSDGTILSQTEGQDD